MRSRQHPGTLALLWLGLSMGVITLLIIFLTGQSTGNLPSSVPVFPLSLKDAKRILVVAPHPDDETIGAAGVIQDALAQGSQVRVVIITNGDGQRLSPLLVQRTLEIGVKEYIQMGEKRQGESLAAMQELGLSPGDVIFLSYPDRGLLPMWNSSWTKDHPTRSSFTGAVSSPYPLTYDHKAAYCGQSLLDDLTAILADFQPDLIFVPHPADRHPDHRASNYFSLQAVGDLNALNSSFQPGILGYLVHYADFPDLSSELVAPPIQPPATLSGPGIRWFSINLTSSQVKLKGLALHAYASQQVLLGQFLNNFDSQDEIFARLPLATPTRPSP
jgi:LmbE family N-acetylglucosaminyl deacetylase